MSYVANVFLYYYICVSSLNNYEAKPSTSDIYIKTYTKVCVIIRAKHEQKSTKPYVKPVNANRIQTNSRRLVKMTTALSFDMA